MKPLRSDLARYFIAIVPPSPIFEEALELKNYCREKYNSKAALNSPPHITLCTPFLWQEQNEPKLIECLRNFASGKKQIDVALSDFDFFAPRVIFISVTENKTLTEFHRTLNISLHEEFDLGADQNDEKEFHPHLTIAFRDLEKQQFDLAWTEFKDRNFSASFTVNGFDLLRHNGKLWQSIHYFHF